MTPIFKAALIRAAIGGVILAGSAFFGSLAGDLAQGQTLGASQVIGGGIAAGVVFFGQLAIRFGVEGYIDTQQAENGGRRVGDPVPPSNP